VPKHASQAARREFKENSPAQQLARHFAAGRPPQFAEALATHEAALRDEGLLGLAGQLRERFAARQVSKLTATFLTLGLGELAAQAGLPDADAAKALVAKCAALLFCILICCCQCSAINLASGCTALWPWACHSSRCWLVQRCRFCGTCSCTAC
jgi:hypothetical protein